MAVWFGPVKFYFGVGLVGQTSPKFIPLLKESSGLSLKKKKEKKEKEKEKVALEITNTPRLSISCWCWCDLNTYYYCKSHIGLK